MTKSPIKSKKKLREIKESINLWSQYKTSRKNRNKNKQTENRTHPLTRGHLLKNQSPTSCGFALTVKHSMTEY